MKAHFKTLLACLVLGVALGANAPASATTSKKKVVAAKKTPVKPAVKKVHRAPKAVGRAAAEAEERHATLQAEDGAAPLEQIRSAAVAVIDQSTGDVLLEKNADAVTPIASITKLMTAMVALDVQPDLHEALTISEADVDTIKGTHSRLAVGATLTREEMLRLALMSSENRAAAALSRYYPGGREAFVKAMNAKAKMLGLTDTRFADPTGLSPENVSSARDLVKLVNAAHQYPLIREFSTTDEYQVVIRGRAQTFRNTNALVRNEQWNIGLSKTGFISEAGKCLVMQAWLANRPMIIVLLDSWGKLTRIADAQRIKRWVETTLASSGRPTQG
jgi:D-alanyl-D-alanine endopeptidase (penicillin-binding protein 7)